MKREEPQNDQNNWKELESFLEEDDQLDELELHSVIKSLSQYTIEKPLEPTHILAQRLSQQWEKVIEIREEQPTLGLPMHVLNLVRPQVQLFRFPFWIISAFILILGGWLGTIFHSGSVHPFAFTTPLIAALSVCLAFRTFDEPMFELEMSFPISATQLIFARLSIIVVYNIAIALLISFVVHGFSASIGLYIINWLIPLGLSSLLALVVMLYYGYYAGLLSSLVLWVIQLTINEHLGILFFFGSDVGSGQWLTSKLLGITLIIIMLFAVWHKTTRLFTGRRLNG